MGGRNGRLPGSKSVEKIPSWWFGVRPGMPLTFWVRVKHTARRTGARMGDRNAIADIAYRLQPTRR